MLLQRIPVHPRRVGLRELLRCGRVRCQRGLFKSAEYRSHRTNTWERVGNLRTLIMCTCRYSGMTLTFFHLLQCHVPLPTCRSCTRVSWLLFRWHGWPAPAPHPTLLWLWVLEVTGRSAPPMKHPAASLCYSVGRFTQSVLHQSITTARVNRVRLSLCTQVTAAW